MSVARFGLRTRSGQVSGLIQGNLVDDLDALAFINAAGITDATQQIAINTLVTDLKTYGVWTKMKAIYPFVGGTATTHKWNLKDPRDLNAAFRLVFNGGWTHSSNGAQPNGTTGYADTFFNYFQNWTTNSGGTSVYRNLFTTGGSDIASFINNTSAYYNTGAVNQGVAIAFTFNGVTLTYIDSINTGLYTSNALNGATKGYRNGIIKLNVITGGTIPNINSVIGKNTFNTTEFSNTRYGFISYHDGLTDTEASNLYTAVQNFNTTLNRYVGVPIVSDSDAQSFLNAAEITDITQANAINQLVTELKNYGIWTKMKAIYPFVGGTATTHKFNLKDPRDLDAAFRLVFNGGWTHSSNGAQPNGTTGYADTKFNPNFVYNVNNNSHLSFYSRTNSSVSNNNEIGCTNTTVSPYVPNVITTFRADQSNRTFLFSNTSNGVYFTDTNSLGFYVSNRIGTQANGYKNGISMGSNTVSDEQRPSITIVIGANNANFGITQYSTKQCAFSSIGDGLTDTEASNLYTAVQNFNRTLSRQV